MIFTFDQPTYLSVFLLSNGFGMILRYYLIQFSIGDELNIPILTLLMMIGEMTGGVVLYLLEIKSVKRKEREICFTKTSILFKPVERVPDHQENIFITYIIIFGLSIIDALLMFSAYLFSNVNSAFYNLVSKEVQLILNFVFSDLILKITIFKHRSTGIILVLSGFLFANLNNVSNINSTNFVLYTFIINIIIALGYSLFEVYHKLVMDRKYIQPKKLLFFLGLFGICILGIIYSLSNFINVFYPDFELCFKIKQDFDEIGKMVASVGIFISGLTYLIICAIVNIGFVLINYYYSPLSRNMVELKILISLFGSLALLRSQMN